MNNLTKNIARKRTLGLERKETAITEESIFNNVPEAKVLNRYIWEKSPYLWTIDNHIKNERGIELEFQKHKFLKDIYDDFTPIQSVRKASQIGFTTMQVLKAINTARYRNFSIIYTLPTFSSVQEVVPAKVNALINQNPILGSWIKDKDSVFQKQVGKGFIYFRGAHSGKVEGEKMESDVGITLTSDLNVMDECDRSDQAVLSQYESRLSASEYRGRWYFSNPTHPLTLSQKVYEQSDQKHWFIKCKNGHWQYLDFWESVKDEKFICKKCGKEITDNQRMVGQWVKKYKDRDISGYWISHLICPWISAETIQKEYETKTRQYFYNFVLGLPYVGSDQTIDETALLKCIDISKPNFLEGNVLGADSGLKKHWVLGNRQGIFKMGVAKDWKEIEDLIKTYDVSCAVLDALPDLTEPRKLVDKYPGIVWLNYYKKDVRKAEFIKWDHKTRTVYSDRTKIFQQVIDDFINRKTRFQMQAEDLKEYISHWKTLYKIKETDSLGIERDVWETSGEDHFAHATNYWRIALERTSKEGGGVKEWQGAEKVIDVSKAPDPIETAKRNAEYII